MSVEYVLQKKSLVNNEWEDIAWAHNLDHAREKRNSYINNPLIKYVQIRIVRRQTTEEVMSDD